MAVSKNYLFVVFRIRSLLFWVLMRAPDFGDSHMTMHMSLGQRSVDFPCFWPREACCSTHSPCCGQARSAATTLCTKRAGAWHLWPAKTDPEDLKRALQKRSLPPWQGIGRLDSAHCFFRTLPHQLHPKQCPQQVIAADF